MSRLPLRHRLVLSLLPSHVRDEHAGELHLALTRDGESPGFAALMLDVARAAPGAHLDVLRQDLRLAWRQLRRTPSFAFLSILTLSLGLGGNLAFFTLVDGVLFRPLALQGEAGLVDITEENIPRGLREFGMSPANFVDYTRDTMIFRAATSYQVRSGTLKVGETQDRVRAASVSGGFFRVFLEAPALGRALTPDDDVVGGNAVVVSHAFHTGVLGGDPDVIGREVEHDGARLRIVGVMPPGFAFPAPDVALWRPLAMPASEWERRGARYVSTVARLQPGVDVARAESHVRAIATTLAVAHPQTNTDWTVRLRSLRASRVDRARPQLYLVWAAGGLVLLVAIANVAGLFIARAVTRHREFALRGALGARAGRVVRQATTEALLLTAISTAAAIGLALLILGWIRGAGMQAIPRVAEVSLGLRSVALGVVLALACALVLGLLAVPSVAARDLWGALGSGRAGSSRGRWQLHRAIVAGEVALASFVLIGAVLVMRTVSTLLGQPLGFDAAQVVSFRVEPPFHITPNIPVERFHVEFAADRQRAHEGYASMLASIGSLPGVQSAGAINRLPLTGEYWVTSVGVSGRTRTSDERHRAWVRPVTTGYLETMRTRIVRGRTIAATDNVGSERVAIIDEAFARRVWGDEDPLGSRLELDGPPGANNTARVVGIAESVHMNRLDAEYGGTMYVPMPQSLEGFFPNWGMDVVVRGSAGLAQVDAFRDAARAAFPDGVVFNVATMETIVAGSVADRRFQLLVLALFSLFALVLATVGVGSALMLVVRERRNELAVRMALGARAHRLWWQVQASGLMVTLVGVMLGTLTAVVGARVFSSLVYGIPLRDPLSFLAPPILLCLASFLAVAIPATRATRVSPTSALREG